LAQTLTFDSHLQTHKKKGLKRAGHREAI